jgi:uncharacterized repeat protein (TIGR03803 family)
VDGYYPLGALVLDSAGNLYGTTEFGDLPECKDYRGCGTVFRIDTSGTETVLLGFDGMSGKLPTSGLILSVSGNFYGTTAAGGDGGHGTVFKLDMTGKETVLYKFAAGLDGRSPQASVIPDAAGNLYGTTFGGGGRTCHAGCGTIFKLDKNGSERVLYRFTGGTDGAEPYAGLLRDSAGNLYGTAIFGGDLPCKFGFGCGTVFKLDTTGTFTALHTFTGGADGSVPFSSLIKDAAGNLYGTAEFGGDLSCQAAVGCGTVFKITP